MLTVSPVSAASLPADRPGLLDHVEAGRGGAGEAEQPHAEAVLAAVLGLLDQPCDSRVATRRNAVLLWTPSSGAISVTPDSPVRASISRIVTARSTDWTGVPGLSSLRHGATLAQTLLRIADYDR